MLGTREIITKKRFFSSIYITYAPVRLFEFIVFRLFSREKRFFLTIIIKENRQRKLFCGRQNGRKRSSRL